MSSENAPAPLFKHFNEDGSLLASVKSDSCIHLKACVKPK